jgi:aryl-alcohol dehydrogenase-like predicted oxidoreductase
MIYRNLGRTGVKVSALCLGGMNFGGRASEEDSSVLIEHAIERGINFIDTANVYGHDPAEFEVGRGRSEEIIGRALKRSGKRTQVVLASKAHFPMSSDPNDVGSSRRHIVAQCEASLRRLQTDHLDLYQLHHPTNAIPIDETLRALDDLVRRGLVLYVGTSSFAAWQFIESLWVSKEYGLNRFISEQPAYNLLDRRLEREFVPMAQTYGIAIMPWSPTAGGFLTGKYRRGQPIPEGTRYDVFWRNGRDQIFTDAAFNVLDVVERLAQQKECTPAQFALAWCMNQPGVTSPIIGPRTLEQLQDNLGVLDITITDEDRTQIDAVALPGRVTVPYYGYDGFAWTTWGPHQFHW